MAIPPGRVVAIRGAQQGSGLLLAPDLVLTAAHARFDRLSGPGRVEGLTGEGKVG